MSKSLTAVAALALAASLTACAPDPAPCPTEDYDGPSACYWDAQHQGNHQGQSFIWDGQNIHYTSK